jgi:hypothetical protein
LTCFIEGVIQGGGLMPSDTEFQLDLTYRTDSPEIESNRSLSFIGEVLSGNEADGYSVSGFLSGNYAVDPGKELRSPAALEVYHRDGSLAAAHLTVESERGGVSFMATLQPDANADAEGALRGISFLGWSDEEDRPEA